MRETKSLFVRAAHALDPAAVEAAGVMRWLVGLAEPEIESCPMGVSPEAARVLAKVLPEMALDPTGWAGVWVGLETEAFGE